MKHKAYKVLGIIATLLTIWVCLIQIKDRFAPTPHATFKVGEYELRGEQIAFHYLIPSNEQRGIILPFPIVISNEKDVDIRKFYLQLKSEIKWFKSADGTNDCYQRLYDRTTKMPKDNGIEFSLEIPRIGKNIQYFDNSKDISKLAEGQEITDYIYLGAIYNNSIQQPFDSFDVEMKSSSKDISEQSYHIKIYCYYAEDMNKTLLSIAKVMNHNAENFIIHLSFQKYMTILRQEDSNYSDNRIVYTVSKDENAIVQLK